MIFDSSKYVEFEILHQFLEVVKKIHFSLKITRLSMLGVEISRDLSKKVWVK